MEIISEIIFKIQETITPYGICFHTIDLRPELLDINNKKTIPTISKV